MNCKRWINLDYIKLSKEISYALRHAPWEYELEMDENGFVDIQQLLSSINEENNYPKLIDKMDILWSSASGGSRNKQGITSDEFNFFPISSAAA